MLHLSHISWYVSMWSRGLKLTGQGPFSAPYLTSQFFVSAKLTSFFFFFFAVLLLWVSVFFFNHLRTSVAKALEWTDILSPSPTHVFFKGCHKKNKMFFGWAQGGHTLWNIWCGPDTPRLVLQRAPAQLEFETPDCKALALPFISSVSMWSFSSLISTCCVSMQHVSPSYFVILDLLLAC